LDPRETILDLVNGPVRRSPVTGRPARPSPIKPRDRSRLGHVPSHRDRDGRGLLDQDWDL